MCPISHLHGSDLRWRPTPPLQPPGIPAAATMPMPIPTPPPHTNTNTKRQPNPGPRSYWLLAGGNALALPIADRWNWNHQPRKTHPRTPGGGGCCAALQVATSECECAAPQATRAAWPRSHRATAKASAFCQIAAGSWRAPRVPTFRFRFLARPVISASKPCPLFVPLGA
jgi:hypothetical protein